jgi:uncharacterized protein (TIGR04255 family)
MANGDIDPLFGEPPKSVPLSKAPLVRVLAQVRFPEIMKINDGSYVAEFQESIRRSYPSLHREEIETIRVPIGIGDQNVVSNRRVVWRFFDKGRNWRLSLTSEFISLETMRYANRSEFIKRLESALSALRKAIEPDAATRLGFRYVNRIPDGSFVDQFQSLIRMELIGLGGVDSFADNVEQNLSDAICRTREGKILARWGWMPSKGTHDPSVMAPLDRKTWILDVDSYQEDAEGIEFEPSNLAAQIEHLGARAYAFFRWSVKDELIKEFGGEI